MKLLLFDVDMTLVSTGGAGLRALNRAFEEMLGIADALDGVAPHGRTDPAIIREACGKAGIRATAVEELSEEILERYVRYLPEEVAGSASYAILPGVVAVLEALVGRDDVALGLATGNIEQGARIKLERGGLNRYFPFGGFGSDSEDRAELVRSAARQGAEWRGRPIEPADTFVIGDTPRDVDAGRAAGFRTVAVATGRFTVDELARTGADLVIADFASGRDPFLHSTRIE